MITLRVGRKYFQQAAIFRKFGASLRFIDLNYFQLIPFTDLGRTTFAYAFRGTVSNFMLTQSAEGHLPVVEAIDLYKFG
jgi:hypothetical protein